MREVCGERERMSLGSGPRNFPWFSARFFRGGTEHAFPVGVHALTLYRQALSVDGVAYPHLGHTKNEAMPIRDGNVLTALTVTEKVKRLPE